MFKESTQILVVLREGVGIYDVETPEADNVFVFYKILPFTLEDFDSWFLIPSIIFHVSKYIRMRLDDNVL